MQTYRHTHTQRERDRRITFTPSKSGNKINKEEPLPTITCRRWPSRHVEKWDAHLSALGPVGEWQRCEHIRHFRPQTRLAQFHSSEFRSGPTWARRSSQVLVGSPLPGQCGRGSARIDRQTVSPRHSSTCGAQQPNPLREICLVIHGLMSSRRPVTTRCFLNSARGRYVGG